MGSNPIAPTIYTKLKNQPFMNKKQRIHVLFSGQVQGVGFRFTTKLIARELGLKGFVRNLSDGRVEVICEGRVTILNEFLKNINNKMSKYICDFIIDWDDAKGEFSIFEIRIL